MTTTRAAASKTLGPYRILAPLGRGGMGELFRAWDPRLEREVALKILHERTETHPDRVRQFVAEARAASALNHPNIITVFDAAVDGATPYIVSELIEGESLRDLIRRGPVPLKRLLDLATQIADGLSEAHAAGIVHRDLKPENIMVTRGGRVKIVDFGLAQPAGFQAPGGLPADVDGQTVTAPGLLAGTVPYMSPEQSRGAVTDFRSDQFSFGLILYEMATGRPAFRRDTPAETLEAIISEEPPNVQTLNPHAPLLLSWITERCLAKNPDDRYGSTADLHRDLRTLRDRLADAVARDPSIHAGRKRAALRRSALTLGSAVAALAAGMLVWPLLVVAPAPDLTHVRFTPFATEAFYEGLPAWSPDGQTIAYAAEVNGILQIFTRRLNSATPSKVTDSPADAKHPFWSHDGRRLYYVALAGTREAIWSVPAAGPGRAASVVVLNASRGAMSPDGATLAFVRDEEGADLVGTAVVWLAKPDGSAERRYDRAPFRDLRLNDAVLSFSPDGRNLGVCATEPGNSGLEPESRGWQFWLLPLPDGEPSRRFQSWSDVVPRTSNFTWIDSRHIVIGVFAAGTSMSQLWLADVERNQRWPLTRSADSYDYPSASPVGDRIVLGTGNSDYDLIEVALDGRSVRAVRGTSRNEAEAVWAPRGNRYAYVTDRAGQDEIWTSGVEQSDERPLVTERDFPGGGTNLLGSPTFSPDGQHLAYVRNARAPIWPLRIWYSPVAGGPPVPLLPEGHQGYQTSPTWSADSQWLAFAEWSDKQWKLVKVRIGSTDLPVILRNDGIANAAPHWSPNGDWITWDTDAGFVLVSAADGKLARPIGEEQWLVHTWSRDGSRIYAVKETDDLRLALIEIDIRTARQRTIHDLGRSIPVNNPLKGLSLDPDGRALLTSIVRLRGDLWVMEGVRRPGGLLEHFWPRTTQ